MSASMENSSVEAVSQTESGAPGTTHFGFREVPGAAKAGLVDEVFSSVAEHYDVMNDVMSMGIHRLWKRFAVQQSGLRPGNSVLDVAAGSADLSVQFARQVGTQGSVTVTDINPPMLEQGRAKMLNAGILDNAGFAIADAEALPFQDNAFHCVSIAFGLRNVTNKARALSSMCRVTRTGGRLLVLEFSRPGNIMLQKAYDAYSFTVIPKLGRLIAGDENSYRYLVESIRKHPDQDTLRRMMLDAGFDEVKVYNLSGGIVALHTGYKY